MEDSAEDVLTRLIEYRDARSAAAKRRANGDAATSDNGSNRRVVAAIARARRDSLVRNSLLIMFTTVVTSGLGYGFWLVAARSLPASVVGLGAALTATMTLISVVACLGIGPALIYELPKLGDDREWSVALDAGAVGASFIALVLAIAAVVFLPLLSAKLHVLRSPAYATAFVVGTVLATLCMIGDSVFVSQRHAERGLVRNVVTSALRVALLLAGVLVGTAAFGILVSWTVAFGAGFVIAGWYLFKRGGRHVLSSRTAILRRAWAMRWHVMWQQLIGFGGNFPPNILPLMVTARLSTAQNAYFYTAWMVGSIFFIISPAVSQSLFAEGSHSLAEVREKATRAAKVVALFLGPCIVVFLAGGGNLILASFGHEYREHAAVLLSLLVLSAIPDAITNLYVSVCRVRGELREAAVLNITMAVGALVIAWVLLPRIGIAAVGWSWLAMQTAGSVYVFFKLMQRRLQRNVEPVT